MKNYTWLLLSAGLFTFACDPDKDSGGDEADADTDADADADADADTDADIENPYTSYEGWESFDYNDGSYGAGEYNCQLVWDLSGSAVNPIEGDCENCEFAFDVSYSLRDASYVYDDGTCDYYGLLGGASGTYGYSNGFGSYGASWVFSYYGSYYWWGYGDFSGSTFTYWYGYKDYPYGSAYYSYYQYGSIDVQ
jgi:hypothetical protein